MSILSVAAASASVTARAATGQAGSARSIIVVGPNQSIQRAVNRARPGTTIVLKKGVYHQAVMIRKDRITLRGAGNSRHGTVLRPPRHRPRTLCTSGFGLTGVCVLARKLDPETGKVFQRVRGVTVTGIYVAGFPGNGVFGYGTNGLTVMCCTGIARASWPADLIWDGTGVGNRFVHNHCGTSIPRGLCH
jgi:hypothetical protein